MSQIHNTTTALLKLQSSHKELQTAVIENIYALKCSHASENSKTGVQYNPLTILGIGETTHSRILGDLLLEKGSHGQGKLFLNEFLKMLEIPHSSDDVWSVPIERGHIDICLKRMNPPAVIVIENKSNWAEDRDSQLYRYWYQAIHTHPTRKHSDCENFKVVYMPPDAKKKPQQNSLTKPTDNSIPAHAPEKMDMEHVLFTFNDHLQTWLNNCIPQIPTTNIRLITFLTLYKELWTPNS